MWWQTDELRRIRPKVEDEVRRNLFFFEAVLFDAVPAVLDEIEHALGVRLVQPVPELRLLDRRRHGRPPRGRRRHARERAARCTASPRCGCCRARVDNLARVFSHSSLRVPVSEELEDSLEPDAEELPSAAVLRRPHREWEPLRTKLGFVHHRLGNTLTPARARARLRRRAGAAARPRARARATSTRATSRWARSGGCCGRSTSSASTSPGSTSARARASCARRRGAVLPGYADADEPRRQALLTEALASGRRGIEYDPGGEAGELLRVLDTVALSAEAYGPQAVPGVRDLDDRAAVGRARRAPGSRSGRARPSLRMVPLFETRAALEEAPATMAELYAMRALRRAPAHAGQPPDGDGRLLGLGQGHGLRRRPPGRCYNAQEQLAAQAARGRHRARALPRPRRLAVARRRAHVPGDPGPARGHGRRPDPDHRAGRDGLRALRRRRSWPSGRWSRRSPPCCWRARCRTRRSGTSGARRWSGSRERSRERYRALVYDDPEFLRFFGQVAPIAELSQLNIGSRPPSRKGVARRRVAARDPVGVRVDAEPPAAAVLVRRGHGAERRRPRAAARDVARLAVLPRADRDARDGAVQDRPRRRRALPDAGRRGHRRSASGPTCRPSTTASSSAC